MRDEGHVAPAAAPAVIVPSALIRTPPHSFGLPLALSYSPALVRTPPRLFGLPHTCSDSPALFRTPPCSFVLPRTRLYPPALLRTPPRTLRTCCCRWCWCSRACSRLVCAGTRYPVAFIWPLFAFVCARSYSFGLIYLYQMQS